jgi:hypothetical protein
MECPSSYKQATGMSDMKKLLFLILSCLVIVSVHAADGFSTLQERMTSKEFKEAGLDKLTSEELAALNEWARRHSVATLKNASARSNGSAAINASSGDMRGFKGQSGDDSLGKIIHGNIAGTFDGWIGKGTLFKLTNGMVWQQDEKDSFTVEPMENAEISIKKSLMGNWHLSVVGYNKKVQVIRIQ